ncbi:MAG: methyltransferase domain-containing protein [Alphaproteobacteria bacterium]|nr:methyltransferase domain-containing protein [Alphaproteobacteria bacterium]
MHLDVIDLKQFYESRLGRMAARMLRRRLRELWPSVAGMRVVGVGYATPFLRPMLDEAERVMAFMPAGQGVHRWPTDAPSRVALADEVELPLRDSSVDRVLLVHTLENTEHLQPMLREVWRVLAPEGRVLIIAPNRRGIWARFERTPFGHGRPFSPPQLNRLLRDNMFSPGATKAALYFPPSRGGVLLRAAGTLERFGEKIGATAVAGALLVEGGKQVYAATPSGRRMRLRPVAPVARPAWAANRGRAHARLALGEHEQRLLAEEIGES